MLTLSPQFFPSFSWQIEEDMIHELHSEESLPIYDIKETDTSHQSLSFSPSELDVENNYQHSTSTKKISHNAYERDRRKKLNYLYSSLRSLLPNTDQNRKLSIPSTVARVLKYIPELQQQVERLRQRKEELLFRSLRDGEVSYIAHDKIECPVVSVCHLDNKEVMIQICILSKTTRILFSKVLKVLEKEGLQIMNASTFTTQEDKSFYSLHLQSKRSASMDGQNFCEHIMNILKEQGRLKSDGNFTYI